MSKKNYFINNLHKNLKFTNEIGPRQLAFLYVGLADMLLGVIGRSSLVS